MSNNLTWTAYKDEDRIIIGAREWQGRGFSSTEGIVEVFIDEADAKNLPKLLRRAKATPMARVMELRRTFNTWGRFEDACDAGHYGAEWE